MAREKLYAVLGMGIFGQSVAKALAEQGCEVLVVDRDQHVIQELAPYVTHAINGDFSDETLLHSIGIGNFDVVIIAIGNNLEDSILATLLVKEMGVPLVIAKAINTLQKKILEKIGVDKVILPEIEMGLRTATSLISNKIIDFFDLAPGFRIAEISPLREWIGKTVASSGIRANYGINIIGIKTQKNVNISVEPTAVLHEDDILVVIGDTRHIDRLVNKMQK